MAALIENAVTCEIRSVIQDKVDVTFMYQIVTEDETWVAYDTSESKQQSIEWRHTLSPAKIKSKQILTPQKVMCAVFWDSRLILFRTVKQSKKMFSARHSRKFQCQTTYGKCDQNTPDELWLGCDIRHTAQTTRLAIFICF